MMQDKPVYSQELKGNFLKENVNVSIPELRGESRNTFRRCEEY